MFLIAQTAQKLASWNGADQQLKKDNHRKHMNIENEKTLIASMNGGIGWA
jgi:hypothetical protein